MKRGAAPTTSRCGFWRAWPGLLLVWDFDSPLSKQILCWEQEWVLGVLPEQGLGDWAPGDDHLLGLQPGEVVYSPKPPVALKSLLSWRKNLTFAKTD